jgi:hypothetical protein
MGLDVRLPVGLLFSAIGVALVVYGMTSDPAIYAKSLGTNVNLWWGLVLLAFGGLMLFLGWRGPAGSGAPKVGPVAPTRPTGAKAGEKPVAR